MAILGTRGVPARYGGFETFAEQLAVRLAGRGHRVTVYRRTRYAVEEEVPGVQVITLPAVYTKHLETISHTALSTLHCLRHPPDVALFCNAVNAPLCGLLGRAGVLTILNVDGLEWQRRKWNPLGRGIHLLSEHLAVALARQIIADSKTISTYYRDRHGAGTVFIPYGGELTPPVSTSLLQEMNLRPGAYDLCVCRFEPENNPLLVVRAHARMDTPVPLVMVGGSPYSRQYEQAVRRAAGPGVRFTGFRFGDGYRQLLFNARAAIFAGEVGGTHPAILEAMAAGLALVYNDTAENREAVGEAGLPYGPGGEEQLRAVWTRLAKEPALVVALGRRARRRAGARYRWEQVAGAYEKLFFALLPGDQPGVRE
ncbi:MAG: DUF1972 domain-containing protein [Acidobacteriota bacterium]